MKVVLAMTAQRFDLSFVDKERYKKGSLPIRMIRQSHNPELLLECRQRAK